MRRSRTIAGWSGGGEVEEGKVGHVMEPRHLGLSIIAAKE
jgi:hypothetical protein